MQTLINNHKMNFVDVGKMDGTPLIFVHAFPMSLEMWKLQLGFFSKDHRCIAYDIRGFGKSDVGDGQSTMELFAEDLIGLQEHLKIPKAVFCGLSMGGYIALRAKEKYPERFIALVLADTKSEADNDEAKIKRAQTIATIKAKGLPTFAEGFLKGVFAPSTLEQKSNLVEEARKLILANSPLGVCGALLAMAARSDTSKALTEHPIPTLLLVGEKDALTPPAAAAAMQARCPHAEMKVIARAGHFSHVENSEEFNSAVLRLVNAVR